MKALYIGVLAVLLAGCVGAQHYESWIGKTDSQLLGSWGSPNDIVYENPDNIDKSRTRWFYRPGGDCMVRVQMDAMGYITDMLRRGPDCNVMVVANRVPPPRN